MGKERLFQHQKQQKLEQTYNNGFEIVTKHQRKCDDTKKLKKYMLSKMFPKNGAKIPEIRNAKIGIKIDIIRNVQKISYS